MNLGITTVVFGEYGTFLPQWLRSISNLTIQPDQITVVFGGNHGVPSGIIWPPNIKVIESDSTNLGHLKNLAVQHTNTEWIMNLSVDDAVLPWAIDEFKKHIHADIIVSKYVFLGEKSLCMHPQISKEVLLSKEYYLNGKNYMHGGTPFKRALWEKHRYHENDCFNTLFWIDCARDNPVFSHTDVPCITYVRWKGSHSDIDLETRRKRFKIIDDYRQHA